MEENRKHIDELFREALGNYTEAPSSSVWDKVEQRLDTTGRKPRPPFWWAWFAVILLVVGAGGTMMIKHWMPSSGKTGNQTEAPAPPPVNSLAPSTNYPATKPQPGKSNPVIADKTTPSTNTDKDNTPGTQPPASDKAHAEKSAKHAGATESRTAKKHKSANQHSHTATTANTSASDDNVQAAAKPKRTTKKTHTEQTVKAENSASRENNTAESPKPVKQHKQKTKTKPANNAVNNSSNQDNSTAETNSTPKNTAKQKVAPKKAHHTSANTTVTTVVQKTKATSTKATAKTKAEPKPVIKKEVKPAVAAATQKEKPAKANTTRQKATTQTNTTDNSQPLASSHTTAASKLKERTHAPKPVVKTEPVKTVKHEAKKQKVSRTTVAKDRKPAEHQPAVDNKAKTQQPVAKNVEPPVRTKEKSSNPVAVNPPASPLDQHVTFPSAAQHQKEDAKKKAEVTTGPDTSDNPVDTSDDNEDNYTSPPAKRQSNFRLSPEVGVSLGYSLGFATAHAAEAIIAPYVQLNLGSKVNIRFSPSYRFGNVSSFTIGNTGTFYNITSQHVDSSKVLDTNGTVKFYNYHYQQTYDSLTLSRSAGGATWAIDVPVSIGYKLGSGVSLFGGPVFSYGNTIKVSADRKEVKDLIVADSVMNSTTPKPPSYFTNLFQQIPHTGQPYANASNPNGADYGTQFRVGYLAGIRYSKGRVEGELSVQQHLSGFSNIDIPEVQKVYSQPYFRLSIGYKILKPARQSQPSMPIEED